MRAELLQLAADLARKREPFVLAMVASDTSDNHTGNGVAAAQEESIAE